MKPIVLIESPYRNGDRNENLRYLAWCELDSSLRGECPISSHGNCTAYWPEDDVHRALGFQWRDTIRTVVSLVAYYVDMGTSAGTLAAMMRDSKERVVHEERMLHRNAFDSFMRGEYPPGSMRRIAI